MRGGTTDFSSLLLLSIVGNYSAGCVLRGLVGRSRERAADIVLSVSILANLGAIGFFKYAYFFISNVNSLFGSLVDGLGAVILPLGISFFTFEQISFLIDIRRREVRSFDFTDYTVFIILSSKPGTMPHTEIGPQLSARTKQPISQNLMIGLTIFHGVGEKDGSR